MERWLITGGCGFIGTRLIKRLREQNPHIRIRVLDNLLVGTKKDLASVCDFAQLDSEQLKPTAIGDTPVELIVGDVRDADICMRCADGITVIVHLAASTGVPLSVEHPRPDMESNVIGTFNLLEAARERQVRCFIFASSGAPIGEATPPIHEELAPHPVSPYGASKLAGEGYCSAYYRTFGIRTIVLRFGNVYGPGSSHKSSVVAKFIRQALESKALEIFGDGNQTRDFIFVDDLIEAILLAAATEDVGGEIFQIATHSETTVNELAQALIKILAQHGIETVNVAHSDFRKGDVLRNYSDTTKARMKLGWQARTSMEEGLKKTVKWFFGRKA